MDRDLIIRLRRITGQPMNDCKNLLESMSESMAFKYVEYYEEKLLRYFIDPIELDEKFAKLVSSVDKEVETFIETFCEEKGLLHRRGLCHVGWKRKAEIFKERYNLDWKSPAKMNKNVIFD